MKRPNFYNKTLIFDKYYIDVLGNLYEIQLDDTQIQIHPQFIQGYNRYTMFINHVRYQYIVQDLLNDVFGARQQKSAMWLRIKRNMEEYEHQDDYEQCSAFIERCNEYEEYQQELIDDYHRSVRVYN